MWRAWYMLALVVSLGTLFACTAGRPIEEIPPDENPPEPVLLTKIADSTDTQEYVKSCIESLTLPEAAADEPAPKRTVEVLSKDLGDGRYQWSTGRYSLETDKQTLTLKTAVALEYPDASGDAKTALQSRMEMVKTCIGNFFGRHGVTLDLSWVEAAAPGIKRIEVREMGVRGKTYNMENWAFGINGLALGDESACTTMTHEFAHILGLHDEYHERGTQRQLGEPDSLMRTAHCPSELVKLYPRHLRTLLTPLCTAPLPASP